MAIQKSDRNGKIKVLHVGKFHSIFDSRIYQKECISLASLGYDVHYITSDSVIEYEGFEQGVHLRTMQGVGNNPNRIKKFFSHFLWEHKAKKKYIHEILNINPDIIHVHEYELGFVVKKIRRRSIKVIYDIHEDNPGDKSTYFQKYGKFAAKCFYYITKHREKSFIKAADGVITATDHISELLYSSLKKKKWQIIYNYAIFEDIHCSSKQIINGDYICYTGGMAYVRKLEMIFEALAWLKKDICIVMIGNIEPWYKEKLKKIYENAKFCGYLEKKEIMEIHKKAFAGMCVLANNQSIYYSLPIKMFEYMRDGIPVIASDFPVWKSIVEENNCGICVPNDTEEIGKAIDFFYTHREEGKMMGKNGRKSVMEKYNWKKEEKKLSLFYKSVLNDALQ